MLNRFYVSVLSAVASQNQGRCDKTCLREIGAGPKGLNCFVELATEL